MKIIAGKLNHIVVHSEKELLSEYSLENSGFVNFSFEGSVKSGLYLKQRTIDKERKFVLESTFGFKHLNRADNEQMMDLLYVTTDLLESTNDVFFIGMAGCSFHSINELKDFFENFLLTNPLKTIVLVDFAPLSLPEFKIK